MDKYVKRIQSRLSHAGYKVSKAECREAFQRLTPQEEWDNPSDAEVSSIVSWLIQESKANEIAIQTELDHAEENAITIPEPQTLKITAQDNPDVWENLQAPEENAIAIPDQVEENSSLATQTDSKAITIEPELTQSISMAIRQLGLDSSSETNQMLSSMAIELSADIKDTEDMVSALVAAYLNKRQAVLSSAVGALSTVRSAQTEAFQSGRNTDFFTQREQSKASFLSQVDALFN